VYRSVPLKEIFDTLDELTGEAGWTLSNEYHQTANKDLSAFFKGFIDKKDAAVREAEEMWEVFNEMEISNQFIYTVLGELFMKDCLNTQQLNAVKKEIELNVQYEGCTDKSLNLLYQHVTFAQKNTHPLIYERVRHTTTLIFNTHYEDFQNF
jgi:hypothetical protein